jgi:hypothetical protein
VRYQLQRRTAFTSPAYSLFIAERTAKINAARLRMAMDIGGEPIFGPRPAS